MKVKCVDNKEREDDLIRGKVYKVVSELQSTYEIVDETENKELYAKNRFIKMIGKFEDFIGLENKRGLIIFSNLEKDFLKIETTRGINFLVTTIHKDKFEKELKKTTEILKQLGFNFEYDFESTDSEVFKEMENKIKKMEKDLLEMKSELESLKGEEFDV